MKIKPWLRYSTNMNFFSSSYKYSGLSTIDNTLMEVDKTLMASWPAKTPEGKAIYAETHANTTVNGTPPYLVDDRARHANNQKVYNCRKPIRYRYFQRFGIDGRLQL